MVQQSKGEGIAKVSCCFRAGHIHTYVYIYVYMCVCARYIHNKKPGQVKVGPGHIGPARPGQNKNE